jgi:hypothetical protein
MGTENHWEWYSFSIFSSGVLNRHHGVVIYPAEVSVLLGCGGASLTDYDQCFDTPCCFRTSGTIYTVT